MAGFRSNLLTLLTGTSIAQALGLLFLPVLTRIYDPEAFGRFGVFYATICVLGILATWRLEMAVMLPKEEREARQVWKTTFWLLLLSTGAFAIMLPFVISQWPAAADHKLEIWSAVTIGLFLIGFAETLMLWHNRQKKFKVVAIKNVVERLSVTAFALAFAFVGFRDWGLIWAQLATLVVICVYMLIATYPSSPMAESVTLARGRELVGSYRDFPLVQGWSMLFVIGATQLPNLLFGSRFPMEETGNVNLAYRIFEAPVNLFAISFSAAFYQHISGLHHAEISRLFRKSVGKLTVVLLPAFIAVAVLAPLAFPHIFGEKWEHVGTFAIPLAAVTFLKILYLSHSVVFLVARKLAMDLKVSGGIVTAQIVGFYAARSLTDSPLTVVTTMCALSCVAYLFGLLQIYRLTAHSPAVSQDALAN